MTALSTEARTTLTTALTGLGYKIYAIPPAVPVTPSIVITPDSPWLVPERLGKLAYRVRLKVFVVVNPRKNDAAQLNAEDAVETVLDNMPDGYMVENIGAPELLDIGAQGNVVTVTINVSVSMA
jgi:hypothetical protein